MKFQSKTNKQFIKTLSVFFVTLGICVVIFIAVGIAVLLTENLTEKREDFSAEQVAVPIDRKTIVAVIKSDKKIFINKICFDFTNKFVTCSFIRNKNVFSLGESETFYEHYKSGGKSELVLALKEYLNEDFKFLEISLEQLRNLTDIYGGVVVNNDTTRLMGLQIEDFINSDETANTVVKGLVTAYLNNTNGKGIRNNFLSLLENSDSDLSYIDFYNHWEEIKSMEGG